MIAELLLQTLIWIAVMGALLFVPAGTLHWPAAWVFLGTMAISLLATRAADGTSRLRNQDRSAA